MIENWQTFPIYLNGEKRFDANPSGELSTVDAYERMQFVHDNIEFCLAEGRLMDVEIFDLLGSLGDSIRGNKIPPFDQIEDLVDRIGLRYGFNATSNSESRWIRRHDSGEIMIWIDRDKIVAESNKRLFS